MAKSSTNSTATKEKKPCPISREDFVANAKSLPVKVGDSFLGANVKEEFSSGSFGWYCGDKVTLMVNGIPVPCQIGLNVTVIGSKPE